ncbi:N-acetylmuramoyl-L-alanine amidase [Streptomyces sp. NPDC006997]|uniref:N-acetylmuramoyl-L-alanine amidase n=1 Tax=Streptomyces sp. NPDC006997 TaxID=3155356 RepID=UPI0034117C23
MRTGPQRYPGASTAYWHQSAYPGSAMETNVILWHATEGTSLPSYGGGASAPNFTAKPDFAARRLVWYQHFDFDTSSRALRNLAGGVETNTMNVCQVEIVGTCDPTTHRKWGSTPHLYTPELPSWVVRDLAAFARWAHEQHGVPLTSGLTFKPYPSSYGSNGVRLSASQWLNFKGHCGHQHAPENDHGDPGAFPMAAILNAAKGTPQEDDMALTADDVSKVAKAVVDLLTGPRRADLVEAVFMTDNVLDNPDPATAPDNPKVWAYTLLKTTQRTAQQTNKAVDALTVGGVDLDALAAKVAASPALADRIAEKVAEKLAARLAD